jgi:ABC-type Fe3+/spermidine/putrescine transport system ATPase subunit
LRFGTEAGTHQLAEDTALHLTELSRRYGTVVALDRLELVVRKGEFVSLLGPSGSGKTTTLRLIGGFDRPSGGRILLDGRDVTHLPAHARDTATIFQSGALFPHKTVTENVAFGLRMRGVSPSAIAGRVAEMLDVVRLRGFADRYPAQLSGGQRQRVALARALAVRAAVLLFDEPLSALDLGLKIQLRGEIKRLHEELGFTAIFVTHDQVEAMALSDRMAVMNRGRIEQNAAPRDIFARPANEFVYTFIGESVCIPVRADGSGLRSQNGSPLDMHLARPLAPGAARIYLRPNRLQLLPDEAAARAVGNYLRGEIRFIEFLGEYLRFHLTCGPIEVFCDQPAGISAGPGERIFAAWHDEDMRIFGDEG